MPLPRISTPAAALFAAACVLVSAAPLARAQSLQELYEAAHGFDATYLSARALAESARYRVEQIEALGRPTVNATAAIGRSLTDYPVIGSGSGDTRSAALNGRYPLFNPGNSATIAQARRSLDSTQADLETAEQDLILRLAQGYFDVLGAQDTLATTRTSKTAITEQLASAKRNFEVGTATITDTREAQARYDLATAQEIAADNDLRVKRIALDQLVGRSGVVPRPLRMPAVLPETVPANVDDWVAVADAQHPAVQRARVALEIAQLETTKARAARLPTVDAVASTGASYARGNAISLPGTVTSASIGVQLNWQVYSGGAVQSRIQETAVLEDKSRNDLQAARRGVAQGTRVAYFTVQSGAAQVKALEAAEASSKLALEATQLGYRVGVRVNLDVLNAQTQLFQTQRDLARARYDVLLNGLRLRQASGRLTADDVLAADRVLLR
jgi:outer membrane protein